MTHRTMLGADEIAASHATGFRSSTRDSTASMDTARQHLSSQTKPARLANLTCPYCGANLAEIQTNKEHVVGRRFVPKGSLQGAWNLIVQACVRCNNAKADLEDDISAISLQADARGQFPRLDPSLRIEAERKGVRSRSRVTGTAVRESRMHVAIQAILAPGVVLRFEGAAPPQLDDDRVFTLARMHVSAFFYWITFDINSKRGGFCPGGYYPLVWSWRADWGNPIQRAFMCVVEEWEPRVMVRTAEGRFKLALRRHPEKVCWSWALEWNENIRVIGFCGDEGAAESLAATFPAVEGRMIPTTNGYVEVREETCLESDEDRLFRCAEA